MPCSRPIAPLKELSNISTPASARLKMPAPKKDLPPGEHNISGSAIAGTHICETEFELELGLSESEKVRCRTCLDSNGYESWIRRSSAQSHLKSEHHQKSEIVKERHEEMQERSCQNFLRDSECSAEMWDTFLAPGALPSIQVNPREGVAPAHPVSVEEEYEQPGWLVDQFINHTEDATHSGANGVDQSLDEWIAATFGEDVLLGPDEEDEAATNVLNAACLFFR
jgi:hypothetical protein